MFLLSEVLCARLRVGIVGCLSSADPRGILFVLCATCAIPVHYVRCSDLNEGLRNWIEIRHDRCRSKLQVGQKC